MAAKKLFRAVTVAPAFVEDEVSKFFVDGYDLTHMAATLTGTGNGGGVMVVLPTTNGMVTLSAKPPAGPVEMSMTA